MKKNALVFLLLFLGLCRNSEILNAQNDPDWFSPTQVYSSNDQKRAGNLIDGNLENTWTPNIWIEQSYWVVFDLDGVYNIEKIGSWHRKQWDAEAAMTEIYPSESLTDWGESVGSLERIYNQTPGWKEADIINKSGRYLKLVSGITNSSSWWEIEIYGKPEEIVEDTTQTEPTDSSNTSDTTIPTKISEVRDGIGDDIDETNIAGQLSANWASVENTTQVTRTGLTLTSGTTYYLSVRAELLSISTISNGVLFKTNSIPIGNEITISCESGTDISDDIQTAANNLESIGGGTIHLPSGEFLFNTTVSMAGGISIIGQGEENIILNSKTTSFLDINRNGNKGGALRIPGISFMGGTPDAGYTQRGISLANIVDFRIDHIYIEGCGYTININGRFQYSKPRGVVDHCKILRGHGTYDAVYGVAAGPYLWENENRIEFLGTQEAVFIEDCYFEGCSHATDGFGGGHYVLRNSTIYNCYSVGGHGVGLDDTGRGIRCSEVYNNTIKKSLDYEDRLKWIMIGIRGGGGVIFNNIIENGQNAIQFTIDTKAYFDSNSDGIYEYPAKDQTHDRWIWNNTLINIPIFIQHYGTQTEELIQENRDYFLRAPSMELDGFNYTPYIYPHPLTQGISFEKDSENNSKTFELFTNFPNDFSLDNAYPNPFNPTTVISYRLPKAIYVTLKAYSILGEEVANLVNEKKQVFTELNSMLKNYQVEYIFTQFMQTTLYNQRKCY